LSPAGRSWRCPRGHAFDIARSGYVNLLQPQDRRSREAGDARAAVEARLRLLASGIGRTAVDRVVDLARHCLADGQIVVDLGSGSGETLEAIARARRIVGVGIDLSTTAAELAARRCSIVTWVVANVDRRVPLLDASADLGISQHARRNPGECARLLRPGGHLLVSVPAADDLIELRQAVQGSGVLRPRADLVISEHAQDFELVSRADVRERHTLDRPALLDVLRGTYRGARTSAAPRLETLTELEVTFASDICVFRRR
jgi:23S rRNA (guanine745-N1)-methyltransferase